MSINKWNDMFYGPCHVWPLVVFVTPFFIQHIAMQTTFLSTMEERNCFFPSIIVSFMKYNYNLKMHREAINDNTISEELQF